MNELQGCLIKGSGYARSAVRIERDWVPSLCTCQMDNNVKFDLVFSLEEEVAPLSYIESSGQLLHRRNMFPKAPVEQKNPMDV